MDFKNSETLKIVTRAFLGECQDGAKYQYLADMATTQKLSNLSTILKQLATNEMAHAKVFYDYISTQCDGGVKMVDIKATYPMQSGSLEEMLEIKAKDEERQAEKIYQEFAKIAEKEGFEDISNKFLQIAKIEACHADVLMQLHYKLTNKTLYNSNIEELRKCLNCGHEEELKKVWKKCPICNMDQGYVKINLKGSSSNIKL